MGCRIKIYFFQVNFLNAAPIKRDYIMNYKNKIKNRYHSSPQVSKLRLGGESFFSALAIMRIGKLNSMNVLAFLFWAISMVFFSSLEKELALQEKETRKHQNIIAVLLSFVFTCFYLSDTRRELVSDLNNKLFQLIILLSVAFGFFLLLKKGIQYGMCKLDSFHLKDTDKTGKYITGLPLFSFILCVLCRIPWLLYSYPGIMTPDSINQFEQVLGMKAFSNHHPWLHTLTISLFYHIGSLFSSTVNGAFVFYTLFQICFMAFAVSYLLWMLSQYTKNLPLLLGILAIYAFLPYHNVMAICIWKDVMFAGTVLLFSSALFYLLKTGIGRHTLFSCILYFTSGFFMCLYRSNGWYAFLLTLPFLVISFRRQWKRAYPLHLILLCLVLFTKGPVMEHFNVEQPDFIESISIPLQQVGRVIATGKELTAKQEELLSQSIKLESVPQLYTEYISDNMKELVRTYQPEYFLSHKGEYFKLWIELGLKYPDTYLDAYIAQTRGYYSPSAVYEVAEADGIIANETGLYREYLLTGKIIVKLREILIKLQEIIPLYGSLWSMGSLFWGTLLFLGFTIGKRGNFSLKQPMNFFDFLTIWMPGIAVIATLLIATPVAIEFRYAYHLAYCIPLYFALMLITKKEASH